MARNRKLQVSSKNVLSQASDIEIPGILAKGAETIFQDLTAKVESMGLLMKVDCYMLSILANEIFDYIKIQKRLEGQDFLITDKDGIVRRNPLVMVRNKLFDNITTISKLYGFSPSGRAGLPVELPAKPNNPGESEFEKRWGEI